MKLLRSHNVAGITTRAPNNVQSCVSYIIHFYDVVISFNFFLFSVLYVRMQY